MNKKVTLLIPCFNEEASLPLLYEALKDLMNKVTDYEWEVLFINDGSRDGTLQSIRTLRAHDSRICYVSLSRNFGKEAAMLAGFDYATGDCVVIMDADLQHPPMLVLEMLKWWEQGFDDVYAKRNSRGRESWFRQKASKTFYALLQKCSRINVLQNVGDFRLLDRKCIETLKQLRETERYTKGLYCWIGFNKKEIVFEQGDRMAGQSAWNFWRLFGLAMEGITSYTTAPLRLSTLLGLIISTVSVVYMCLVFAKTILWGDPAKGFPTLAIIILFLGGVQLISLGIIGEYIGRIFNETKRRPVYVVQESER